MAENRTDPPIKVYARNQKQMSTPAHILIIFFLSKLTTIAKERKKKHLVEFYKLNRATTIHVATSHPEVQTPAKKKYSTALTKISRNF